jgi:hypothetical protein
MQLHDSKRHLKVQSEERLNEQEVYDELAIMSHTLSEILQSRVDSEKAVKSALNK